MKRDLITVEAIEFAWREVNEALARNEIALSEIGDFYLYLLDAHRGMSDRCLIGPDQRIPFRVVPAESEVRREPGP